MTSAATGFAFSWSHLPPTCLLAGLIWGLVFGNPYKALVSRIGKSTLQISVVLLGFSVSLGHVLEAGKSGFFWTLVTLSLTLAVGAFFSRVLGLSSKLGALVSVGTAICGGSAIAAAAPMMRAESEDIAAALATVFLLNAVGLFVFPWIGHALGMSPQDFGTWAALAIHDTSSVVGAALAYDPESLATATTIKLTRALWILPVSLFLGWVFQKDATTPTQGKGHSFFSIVPWFIPGFLLASLLRSFVIPPESVLLTVASVASKIGLSISLLCIGAAVSKKVFLQSGAKALGLGVSLWVLVSGLSLWAIVRG